MKVAIYCGASSGNDSHHADQAAEFARDLASQGVAIVYGGGHHGLMGVIADAALAAGGEVHGVIPASLVDKELAHPNLTTQQIVNSLYERKELMIDMADAAIALPGGLGTLDELFDVWGSAQLALHPKPVGLLNTSGFWSDLLSAVGGMRDAGFISERSFQLLLVADNADDFLTQVRSFTHPGGRWSSP